MLKRIFKIFVFYPLYFLQLENYQILRFLRTYIKKAFVLEKPRQNLVWTNKIKAIFLLSLVIIFYIGFIGAKRFPLIGSLLIIFISLIFFFLIVSFSVIILWPFDWLIKKIIIAKATKKIKKLKNLQIIGITGSYGKTTFKEILSTILSVKYKVVFTPENKNTPLGISNVILKNLKEDTEIFVVEMSAWQKGDIKTLCKIAPPDIAVLTGINESHLERFKTIENTIQTKFEIVKYSKPNSLILLNADNDLILKNYQKYISNKKVIFYGKEKKELFNYIIRNISFDENLLKQKCQIEIDNKTFEFEVPLLGDYAVITTIGAILIAKHLNLEDKEIKIGINLIKPVNHRLQPVQRDNFLIIDDSYNGNPNGAKAAIELLNKFKNKRKIYVTPGLVEMGKESRKVHEEIGKLLASVADLVILIKNSVTDFIISGLLEKNFDKDKIIVFDNPLELQDKIKEIIKPNDVVLFQNDWPDNYL